MTTPILLAAIRFLFHAVLLLHLFDGAFASGELEHTGKLFKSKLLRHT